MVPAALSTRHRGARAFVERATRSSTAATRTTTTTSARAKRLSAKGLHYVDMGTSGGVWGLERGYCLMIGGEKDVVARLDPVFKTLAPGVGRRPRTPGREKLGGTAEHGYLHCGPDGARRLRQDGPQRHRVRHHGGLRRGPQHPQERQPRQDQPRHEKDAETTPLRDPEHYMYDFEPRRRLRGVASRQRISSWLLDLTAQALAGSPSSTTSAAGLRLGRRPLDDRGRERPGRAGARAHVALFARFDSRGLDDFRTSSSPRCASASAVTSRRSSSFPER